MSRPVRSAQLLFTLVLLLLGAVPGLTRAARAQADDYQPGYVLPATTADTLRGQLRVLSPQRGQRECVFQADAAPTGAGTTYGPAQLRGYGYAAGAQFRRGRVVRGANDTTTVLRFQEVLVAGAATLLYATDEGANPHYYLLMAGAVAPTELRQLKRRVEDPLGRVTLETINQYQQVLLSSLAACPALAPDIRRGRLSEDPLADLVRRYNACVAPVGTAIAPAPTRKSRVTLNVLAGAAFAQQLMLRTNFNLRQYNQTLTAPPAAVPGVQLTLRNARLSRHLGLSVGVFYQRRNYRHTLPGVYVNSFTSEDRLETAYAASFVSLPLTMSWEFGRHTWRPLLFGGFNPSLQLSERENSFTTYFTNNSRPAIREGLFPQGDVYRTGYVLGAGLSRQPAGGHELGVQVRYENLGPVAPFIYINSKASAIVVLLSYGLSQN